MIDQNARQAMNDFDEFWWVLLLATVLTFAALQLLPALPIWADP